MRTMSTGWIEIKSHLDGCWDWHGPSVMGKGGGGGAGVDVSIMEDSIESDCQT